MSEEKATKWNAKLIVELSLVSVAVLSVLVWLGFLVYAIVA